jgi:hypothetical protein
MGRSGIWQNIIGAKSEIQCALVLGNRNSIKEIEVVYYEHEFKNVKE